MATCVGPLFSSHWMVSLFGIAAALSFAVAYGFYSYWFISVWCFLAAAMSGIVYLQLRPREAGRHHPAPDARDPGVRTNPSEHPV
jgi:uncharacterized membrane protein